MISTIFGLNTIEKKHRRTKIIWTNEMINTLSIKFPVSFNRELAKELGVSMRSLIRKARELGIDKVPGFLEINRTKITQMAVRAHPAHPYKGCKGWSVPNSENTRFKSGQISCMLNPEIVEKVRKTRNETIARDRIRRKYGLSPLTKINLKVL